MEFSNDWNDSIITFCEITGCDIDKAKAVLESANWNLESAVTLYYEEEQINEDSGINNEIQSELQIGNSFNINTVTANNIGQSLRSSVINCSNNDPTNQGVNTASEHTGGSQNSISEPVNKFNKFMRIFIAICGTGLATFLTFFKTMFCFPEDNNERRTSGSNQRRIHVNNVTSLSLTPTQIDQIEQNRKIREEQDIEYMKSLNLDSMKREKANKKKKMKEALTQRRIKHSTEVKNEVNVEIDKESCSRVCVKNLAGKKFQRDFNKNDNACKIYKWIDSLGLEGGNLISDRFSLRLPHSKSVEIDESYLDKNVTIEELGLFPSALLLINNIDDDSDYE
ncbi:hypothetical protein FG386_002360 [Cryptosporidium ryanae]|uniref:uncharacterized protein n=1 Tax=Cryptosporidium ryanae TaxID=515981 RepID=UPI00351A728A|nr:hypothetical protein FG386_002360 [Cryptosporidium ryanae]